MYDSFAVIVCGDQGTPAVLSWRSDAQILGSYTWRHQHGHLAGAERSKVRQVVDKGFMALQAEN